MITHDAVRRKRSLTTAAVGRRTALSAGIGAAALVVLRADDPAARSSIGGAPLVQAPPRPVGKIGFTLSPPAGDGAKFRSDLAAVRALGASWVRLPIDFGTAVRDWTDAGRIEFDEVQLSTFDAAFDLIGQAGLSVVFLTVDGVGGLSAEDYLTVMVPYWAGLAARFGSRISVWQVFNEANGRHYLDYSTLTSAGMPEYLRHLAEALESARTAIHAHAPHIAVTTNAGGFPLDGAAVDGWMRYFAGIAGSLDLLSVDPYPQLDKETIASLPHLLSRVGRAFDRPVAVAETGLQTGPGLFSEAQQSTALTSVLSALAGSTARHTMIYRLRDDGAVGDDGFGVLYENGVRKLSFDPVARAIADHYPEG